MAETSLERIESAGFRKAGEWCLAGDTPRCNFSLHKSEQHVLYAFVSGHSVLYIGKSRQPLFKRLNGYSWPTKTGQGQSTNKRGNKRLREYLLDERSVDVWVRPDDGVFIAGFHANSAAALEDDLIAQLQPPWNLQGMSRD
jgi:hypothetical protein